jgi:hypothetical protein
MLPIYSPNEQQHCVCGQYYELRDYESNLIEKGYFDFYKDLTVVQDYAVQKTYVVAHWINMEFPIEEDLLKLKDKIKLYVLMS